jgi:hypothetical protein
MPLNGTLEKIRGRAENPMANELWGLLGLGGVLLFLLASPYAAVERETMQTVIQDMMPR